MTKCGHYFHAECLGRWLDRNVKCPLCQNINFSPVIVYCDRCNYRACGLKTGMNYKKNGDDMKEFAKYYCEGCKEEMLSEERNKP